MTTRQSKDSSIWNTTDLKGIFHDEVQRTLPGWEVQRFLGRNRMGYLCARVSHRTAEAEMVLALVMPERTLVRVPSPDAPFSRAEATLKPHAGESLSRSRIRKILTSSVSWLRDEYRYLLELSVIMTGAVTTWWGLELKAQPATESPAMTLAMVALPSVCILGGLNFVQLMLLSMKSKEVESLRTRVRTLEDQLAVKEQLILTTAAERDRAVASLIANAREAGFAVQRLSVARADFGSALSVIAASCVRMAASDTPPDPDDRIKLIGDLDIAVGKYVGANLDAAVEIISAKLGDSPNHYSAYFTLFSSGPEGPTWEVLARSHARPGRKECDIPSDGKRGIVQHAVFQWALSQDGLASEGDMKSFLAKAFNGNRRNRYSAPSQELSDYCRSLQTVPVLGACVAAEGAPAVSQYSKIAIDCNGLLGILGLECSDGDMFARPGFDKSMVITILKDMAMNISTALERHLEYGLIIASASDLERYAEQGIQEASRSPDEPPQ